jgi:flagellar biosynthesis protein FliR
VITFTAVQLDAWLAGFLLPFVRILGLFTSAPIFSNRSFPVRARIGAAAAMAFLVAPLVSVPPGLTLGSAAGLGLVLQQLAVGLALGFAARLLFAIFEVAGEVIGLQMGLSFAGFFNPQGGTQTAVGTWVNAMAVLLFLSLNGHLLLIDALVATFRSMPISAEPFEAIGRLRLEQLGGDVFRLALVLALPAVLLMLFINLVLGFASRVAPQISIFAVGFPITVLAGLLLLSQSTRHLLGPMLEGLDVFLAPFR